MRADDLRLGELVDFAEGRLSLHGRRLVLHDLHAMAQFRADLLQTLGLDDTRRILTRFGYFWGQADAAAMERVFTWDSVEEWMKAGPRLHTLQGVARSVVRHLEMDPASGRFHLQLAWHDSGEAEEHVAEMGPAKYPVCWMLAGYASGYASFCLGRPVYVVETSCRAQGDPACLAEGRDEASWGAELDPYRAYFRADDIQGKVKALSAELRRKDRELARSRQRLDRLEGTADTGLAEVSSSAFRRVLETAARVARFDTSVVITGESGTGKEVLARYLHRNSARAQGPFVAINCSALPETLLEGELFGHKAGAFTGATETRSGLLEQAQRGTVFLDEIGEVTPAMQAKLLRVLQEREVLRLGENRPRKIDVRVVAATNRRLQEAVRQGRFREDLYYRLAVVEIEIPPLRDRREDILPLARYFVARLSRKLGIRNLRLDAACLDVLQAYGWPGNVRELENAIERAAVFARDGLVVPEGLPPAVCGPRLGWAVAAGDRTLAAIEQAHIVSVLQAEGGNRARAARALGISPVTLWRRLRSAGVPAGPRPAEPEGAAGGGSGGAPA